MRRASLAVIALMTSIVSVAPSRADPNGGDSSKADVGSDKASSKKVSARATVMVKSYTADPTLTLRRNKGIDSIRRYGTGVYCLKPEAGIKAKEAVAAVTVNWVSSYGNNLLATIAAPSYDCAGNEFEVRTYKFAAGADFAQSDDVSFTLVVP